MTNQQLIEAFLKDNEPTHVPPGKRKFTEARMYAYGEGPDYKRQRYEADKQARLIAAQRRQIKLARRAARAEGVDITRFRGNE